jgi:hypothetical protein
MPKRAKKREARKTEPQPLTGWSQIAAFLGEPTSVVQRWASEGMPVRRQGRHVETTPDELNDWLGKESGKPVHVATENTDLTAELKRGLSFVRQEKPAKPTRKAKLAARKARAKRKIAAERKVEERADRSGIRSTPSRSSARPEY